MAETSFTARELAERFGLQLHGDGDTRISGVATLARADAGQLAFLANPRYRAQLDDSGASVVVMRAGDADGYAGTALIAPLVVFLLLLVKALVKAKMLLMNLLLYLQVFVLQLVKAQKLLLLV